MTAVLSLDDPLRARSLALSSLALCHLCHCLPTSVMATSVEFWARVGKQGCIEGVRVVTHVTTAPVEIRRGSCKLRVGPYLAPSTRAL